MDADASKFVEEIFNMMRKAIKHPWYCEALKKMTPHEIRDELKEAGANEKLVDATEIIITNCSSITIVTHKGDQLTISLEDRAPTAGGAPSSAFMIDADTCKHWPLTDPE